MPFSKLSSSGIYKDFGISKMCIWLIRILCSASHLWQVLMLILAAQNSNKILSVWTFWCGIDFYFTNGSLANPAKSPSNPPSSCGQMMNSGGRQSWGRLGPTDLVCISTGYYPDLEFGENSEQARKIGISYLQNLKLSIAHSPTGVGAQRCYRI